MQLAGAWGNGLSRYFRADASSHLITNSLRKSKLAVTRIRRDTPGHGLTAPLPPERAFSVLLQLRDSPRRELFIGGRSVHRGGYGARTTSIVDLEQQPTANLESPFDAMHFYVSRAALNEIADEQGAPRVQELHCERGVFDPTVWHLGAALLPALERPGDMGAMYADHLLLASHTYFAMAFGGMRLQRHSRRGGLAPWQVRCATELMIERLGDDISLAVPANACGFSDQSHFTRVFTRIVGSTPGSWRKQVL